MAPIAADIDPPPGAGDSDDVSQTNEESVMSTSFFWLLSCSIYSIIFSSGLNGFSSESPIDRTAVKISSASETPAERCCLCRKYLPASSIAFSGISPTSSDPVTLLLFPLPSCTPRQKQYARE